MKKTLLIMVLIIFLLIVFFVIEKFVGGGNSNELVYFPYSRPDYLIPILDTNEEAKYLNELIFDGLVNKTTVDDRGKEQYEWALVDKGGYVEESPENVRLITIYLKKGILWHDGREFTAEDIIYTWKAINESNSPLKGWLNTFIENITPFEGDNYKFKVALKVERSREAFMELFSPIKILPRKYIYKNKVADLPFNLNDGSEISKEFNWKPIGTGPYKITKRESEMVQLESYEPEDYHYYMGKPEIKWIRMQAEKDPIKAVKALKGSKLGLLFDVKPESFEVLKEMSYRTYLPYGFYAIVYNTRKAPFNNLYFRKAVSSATNKTELSQKFVGSAEAITINTSIFPANSMYVQESPDSFGESNPFNSARAAVNLNQSSGGERTFHILVSSAIEGQQRTNEFTSSYVKMMNSNGIKVVVDDATVPHYLDKIKRRDFDAVFMSFSGFDHLYDIRGLFKTGGERNIWGIADAQLVGFLDEFGATIAWDKLNVLSRSIHSRIEEITPACFLFTAPRRAYYSNKLTDVTVHPEVGFSTVEKWKLGMN